MSDLFVSRYLPMPTNVKTGDLAYVDSFSGLIPCKIVSIVSQDGELRITVKVTANRKGWHKGETDTFFPFSIVPRSCVHVRSGQYRISTNYTFTPDTKEV